MIKQNQVKVNATLYLPVLERETCLSIRCQLMSTSISLSKPNHLAIFTPINYVTKKVKR